MSIREIFKVSRKFNNAMLTTTHDGELRSRPMSIAEVDDDRHLVFVTSMDTAKADEIAVNTRVNVSMQGLGRFVSISGTARLVRDADRIAELWRPSWSVWFPDGPQDENAALIEVVPTAAEYWTVGPKDVARFIYEAGKSLISGKRPNHENIGDNETVFMDERAEA